MYNRDTHTSYICAEQLPFEALEASVMKQIMVISSGQFLAVIVVSILKNDTTLGFEALWVGVRPLPGTLVLGSVLFLALHLH